MIDIDGLKAALRVVHDQDDDELQRLLDSATAEYKAFVEYDEQESSSSSEVVITADAIQGIVLMVRADYDAPPEKRDVLRAAAETLWMPYRRRLGV